MKALLVDDHALVREGLSLKLQLEDPEIEVRSCGTIELARQEIDSFQPDLLFLDVKMGSDREAGLKFLEEIKDSDFAGRVVMLSSETDRTTVGQAIAAGAVGFVSKSDDSENALTRAIDILLQGGVYISEDVRQARDPDVSRGVLPSRTTSVKEVGPETLRITAPKVYETLWHIANGDSQYKTVAKKMGISNNTASEYARQGFNALNLTTKDQFLVLLSRNGWRLRAPGASH